MMKKQIFLHYLLLLLINSAKFSEEFYQQIYDRVFPQYQEVILNSVVTSTSLLSLVEEEEQDSDVNTRLGDHQNRFESFKIALDQIEVLKEKNGEESIGINRLTFMTEDEKRMLFGLIPLDDEEDWELRERQKNITIKEGRRVESLRASVDWSPFLSKMKDQFQCSGCWAFAATGLIEAHYAIHNQGTVISLSEQQLLDCDRTNNNGCSGGNYFHSLRDYTYTGMSAGKSYPYVAHSIESCLDSRVSLLLQTFSTDVIFVDRTEDALMEALNNGPVAVAVAAYNPIFQYYTGGIIQDSSGCGGGGSRVDHAALLVGYDTSPEGVPYWRLKNSWGEDWGEGGYVRLKRGVGGLGMCGILTQANTLSTPPVCKINSTTCDSFASKEFTCLNCPQQNSTTIYTPNFVPFVPLGVLSSPAFIAGVTVASLLAVAIVVLTWFYLMKSPSTASTLTDVERGENVEELVDQLAKFNPNTTREVLKMILEEANGDIERAKHLLKQMEGDSVL